MQPPVVAVSVRGRRRPADPVPFWEQAYGMELDSVTRFRDGNGPSASVILARRQAERERANGATPGASTRLHGTRLDVNGRALLLLTLALPGGGWRMVAVDGATGGVRELWRATSLSRMAASRRHYSAVAQVQGKHGARIVTERGHTHSPADSPDLPTVGSSPGPRAHHYQRAGQPADCGAPWGRVVLAGASRTPCGLCLAAQTGRRSPWLALRMRLTHDGPRRDPVGDIARLALSWLDEGDLGQVLIEILDAARVDFGPLADAAGTWLRLLGYDTVHALIPEGPDHAYASQLLQWDAEVLGA